MNDVEENNIDDILDPRLFLLKKRLEIKDLDGSIEILQEIYDAAHSDNELCLQITDPRILTTLQGLIIEQFEIPGKGIALKHRISNRKKRAIMFSEAMKKALIKKRDRG